MWTVFRDVRSRLITDTNTLLQMKILLLFVLVFALLCKRTYAESRPWCLDGVGLCRGKDPASEQFSHTMTIVPGTRSGIHPKAFLLGGQRSTATSSYLPLSTINTIDLADMTVTTSKVTFDIGNASARPQRSGHSAVLYNNSVLVFGGSVVNRTESKNPVVTNEVTWLDPGDTFRASLWRVLFNRTKDSAGGTVPVPRQNAAAAVFGDTLWIFGGIDNDTRILDDTWSFNILTGAWKHHTPSVPGSVPRDSDDDDSTGLQNAAMIASVDGNYLVLYGGRSKLNISADPEPQNRLWVFNILTGNWREVRTGLQGTQNPVCNDAVLMFYQTNRNIFNSQTGDFEGSLLMGEGYELLVASTGFWKPTNDSKTSSYKMWVNVKESTTGGNILQLLNDTFAATETPLQTRLKKDKIFKSKLFIANNTKSILQVDRSSTPIKTAEFAEVRSFPERITAVKDAALGLHYSSMGDQYQLLLLISGGREPNGKATSKLLIVDLNIMTVIDTSNKLKPGLVESSKVLRYGEYTVAPRKASDGFNNGNMLELLIYTGIDNLGDDDEPLLTDFMVIDTTAQQVLPRCSSKNKAHGTCKVLPVSRGNTNRQTELPGPRDGLSYTSIYQVFTWSSEDGSDQQHVGGRMLLMYGGMRLVGDSQNDTTSGSSVDSLLTEKEVQLRNMLGQCDTQGSLDSVQLDNMAVCGAAKLEAGHYCSRYSDIGPPPMFYDGQPPSLDETPSWPPSYPNYPSSAPPMQLTEVLPARRRRRSVAEVEDGSLLMMTDGEDVPAEGDQQYPNDPYYDFDNQELDSAERRSLIGNASADAGSAGGVSGSRKAVAAAGLWGNRAAAAVAAATAASSSSYSQRTTKAASKGIPLFDANPREIDMPTVYGTAYAVLWQSSDEAYRENHKLVNGDASYVNGGRRSTMASGKGNAFYYDLLFNVNGSTRHAPGERAAASLTNLPYNTANIADITSITNTDAILFGGLTAVNRSNDNNMLGIPVVTNDVYYLQYIPGVPGGYSLDDKDSGDKEQQQKLPEPRFPSCPFPPREDGISSCKSVAVFPQDGEFTSEPSPPSGPEDFADIGFEDCPDELTKLEDGVPGIYQLRVYRSLDKKFARSMQIGIYSMSTGIMYYPLTGKDLANGLCCAGNSTGWAWPPNVASANIPPQRNTTASQNDNSTSSDEYWLYLPNGEYYIALESGGNGWAAHEDLQPPFNCSTKTPNRCPRMELYNYDSKRNIRGLGGLKNHTIWISNNNYSGGDDLKIIRLSLCSKNQRPPLPARPPAPSQTPPNPYPFVVEDQRNYLRSYELQLAPDHPMDKASMPKGRMWHASCFVETKSLPKTLGFGGLGVLAIHGGVTTHIMDAIDIETELLEDLWLFDLEYRRWTPMSGSGDSTGKRLKHNMKAEGTVIFLSGGFTYDSDKQDWPYSTKVHYIDLQLGLDAVWTHIEGDEVIIGRRTTPTAITHGMGVSQRRSQITTLNDQGVVFVPLPISAKLDASTIDANSSNSSTPFVLNETVLDVVFKQMYDGDLLLLPENADLSIKDIVTIGAAVVLHGKISQRYSSSSPPPPAGPAGPAARRRAARQQRISDVDGLNLHITRRTEPSNRSLLDTNNADDADADACVVQDCGGASGGNTVGGNRAVFGEAHHRLQKHQRRRQAKEMEMDRGSKEPSAVVSRRGNSLIVSRPPLPPPPPPSSSSLSSSSRIVLSEAELRAALEGTSQRLVVTSEPQIIRSSEENTRKAREAVRRILQSSSTSSSSSSVSGPSGEAPTNVNVTDWMAMKRTRVKCENGGTFVLQSASNLVNLEFIDCQVIVNKAETEDVSVGIVNCIFRDTVDRPAIVVRSGGRVAIVETLFYNNTYISPLRNNSTKIINGTIISNSDLYWGAGSAIYVMPRGVIEGIWDSAFVNNGNGPGSTRGGAIFLTGPGSCLDTIAGTTFLRNGRSSATVFLGGGAIYGNGMDGCDFVISNTNFSGNVGDDGGSIYLSDTGARDLNFTGTKFWNNTALRSGGAFRFETSSGTLTMTNTQFVNNTATEEGGAISLDSINEVIADRVLLDRNSASVGTGGGLTHSRGGSLLLMNCTVSRNRALYGGGLGCGQGLSVLLINTLITNNSADVHGGGLECFQCYNFTAIRTDFIRNRASSGGGLVLNKVEQGAMLTSAQLSDNVAMPVDGTTSKLTQAGCGRDAHGGGGGLCIDLQRSVILNGVNITNNSAVAGGGAYVQQRCLPGVTGCGPTVISNSVFVGNAARGGGGGAVFRTTHNLTNVTCPGDGAPTAWQQLHTACPSSWKENTALYGNVTATIAYGITLVSPARLLRYRSNDPVELVVIVQDYHNQTIIDGTSEATTSIEVQPSRNSSVLLAGNTISTIRGKGNFSSVLRLQAKPGNYVVSVTATRTIQEVPPLELSVQVRPCIYGEITNKEGTQCYPCDLGTFSLNSSNTTCEPCPDNANCSVGGFPWVTMPKPGYWHSGPRSPNILSCVYEAACTGNDTWPRQDNIAKYLKSLDNYDTTTPYNLTTYYALQCSEGYMGIMCGRCEPDYGRSGSGKCRKCPSRVLNALWYILSTFVNIFFIFLTIRGQLPGSLTNRHQLEELEQELLQKQDATAAKQPKLLEKGMQKAHTLQRPLAEAVFVAEETQQQQLLSQEGLPPPLPPSRTTTSVKELQSEQIPTTATTTTTNNNNSSMQTSQRPSHTGSTASSSLSLKDEDRAVSENKAEGPYKGGNHGTVLKILISYMQVASLIRGISAPWPSMIQILLSTVKTVSSSVTTFVSIDCSLSRNDVPISVQRVVITISTPFAIMAMALVLWLILFVIHRRRRDPLASSFLSYMSPRVIITVISIVFYVYPDMTNTFISLFSCPIVDPEDSPYSSFMAARGVYWQQDPDLKCYIKPHLYLVTILGAPGVLFFAIGAPIFSLVWLKTHHALLYTSPDFGVSYGFLYNEYKRVSYFWESVVMFRKLAIIAVIVLLQPQGQYFQIIGALGVILVATIAQITIKPYKSSRMNELERLSLYALVLILYFALLFIGDMPNATKFGLGVMLTLANIALIIYFVWKYIHEISLFIIWTIDDHSNADGKLEWEDIWRYVDAEHANKSYTGVLIKTLRGLQSVTTFIHSMVARPVGAVSRASSQLRNRLRSQNRIQPRTLHVFATPPSGPVLALQPPDPTSTYAAGDGTSGRIRTESVVVPIGVGQSEVQDPAMTKAGDREPLPLASTGFRRPLSGISGSRSGSGSGSGSRTKMAPGLRGVSGGGRDGSGRGESGGGSSSIRSSKSEQRGAAAVAGVTRTQPDRTTDIVQQYGSGSPGNDDEDDHDGIGSNNLPQPTSEIDDVPCIPPPIPVRVPTKSSMISTQSMRAALAGSSDNK